MVMFGYVAAQLRPMGDRSFNGAGSAQTKNPVIPGRKPESIRQGRQRSIDKGASLVTDRSRSQASVLPLQ